MVEIVDRESAEAWAVDAPRKSRIAFAARAALRALPALHAESERDPHTSLRVLRAAITTVAGSASPYSEHLKLAAASAAKGLDVVSGSAELEIVADVFAIRSTSAAGRWESVGLPASL